MIYEIEDYLKNFGFISFYITDILCVEFFKFILENNKKSKYIQRYVGFNNIIAFSTYIELIKLLEITSQITEIDTFRDIAAQLKGLFSDFLVFNADVEKVLSILTSIIYKKREKEVKNRLLKLSIIDKLDLQLTRIIKAFNFLYEDTVKDIKKKW